MDYIIKYTAIDRNGLLIKSGKIKANNKNSEFEAKVTFEKHLQNKYSNFGRLVIHNCYGDSPPNNTFDIDFMKDLFK